MPSLIEHKTSLSLYQEIVLDRTETFDPIATTPRFSDWLLVLDPEDTDSVSFPPAFHYPREQFNVESSMKTPYSLNQQENLLHSNILEHYLNLFFMHYTHQFQETTTGLKHCIETESGLEWFQRQTLKTLLSETASYLDEDPLLSAEDLEMIRTDQWEHPNMIAMVETIEAAVDTWMMRMPKKFYTDTRLGLEWAEWCGYHQVEQLLTEAQANEWVVLVSPFSPKRGTAATYSFTNLYRIRDQKDDTVRVESIHIRSSWDPHRSWKENMSLHQSLFANHVLATPEQAVSTPFITNLDPEVIIEKLLGLSLPQLQEYIQNYETALLPFRLQIKELAQQIQGAAVSPEVLTQRVHNLGWKIIDHARNLIQVSKTLVARPLYEVFEQTEQHYGHGGACGTSSELDMNNDGKEGEVTLSNTIEDGFPCPKCEAWIPWGSGDRCPHCHYSKQDHARITGILCA